MTLPFSNRVTSFAETNHRARAVRFGIKRADRLFHMYVIGKTGTGKSTLLEAMARQDVGNGEGFALIDPHGDLVERVAAFGRALRPDDVIYLNVPNPSQPYGYNPLRRVSPERRPLAASGLLEVFKKRWSDSWGVRMEHILRHAILTLLDQPDVSLPDLLRLLTDEGFRAQCLRHLANQQVRSFWMDEYALLSTRQRSEAIAPIQNKVGAFLADPRVRRVVTGGYQPIMLRRVMDEGKILLVNLAKGTIGEDSASLLGALLVTTLGLAAFSRADRPEGERRPFFVYIDEFQNFTTLAVAAMASELRKYRVGLVMAHQYLSQLDADIQDAVMGNAGTVVSFRLGPHDAAIMARLFQPKFTVADILNLPNYHIYLKLMIDGAPSQAFSGVTVPPSSSQAM